MKQKSTIISLIIGAVILIAIALTAVRFSKKAAAPQSPTDAAGTKTSATAENGFKVLAIDDQKASALLPADFPAEASATVLQNAEATNDQLHQRLVNRVYISQKSLQENFTLFKQYLTSHSWTVTFSSDTKDSKTIAAQNGDSKINIVMQMRDGKAEINISYRTSQ